VELGGAIELHAAFREESRTSLPSVSAALQEIRESQSHFRGFLPRKTTPRDLISGHSHCETALAICTGCLDAVF
jgi:hypothetical protein